AAGARDAQDLACQHVLIARRVVRAGASAVAGVVAAAVADGDVEIAVLSEVDVSGVVVAGRRGHVVDEDELRRRADGVTAHGEARDAVEAGAAGLAEGAEEIDEAVRRDGRLAGHAEEALLGARADGGGRKRDRRRGDQGAALVYAQAAALLRDEQTAVGREGERGRRDRKST